MEKSLFTIWVGLQVVWNRQRVLARLMESQIWYLPASSVALWMEGSEKGQWLLPTFLSERKLSPALALMPDTPVPPCMPLEPFKLFPECWHSEGVSLSKSVWGFFKGNCLGLQKLFPPTQSPLDFAARRYGDLSFCHWNPALGCLLQGWDSSLLRYPSKICIHHT